jgi:hypothetical protein
MPTYTSLTPTVLSPDNVANDLTTLAAAGVSITATNGVTFSNPMNVMLLVLNTAAAANTASVQVGGSSVLGLPQQSWAVSLATTATDIQDLGLFHSIDDQPGTTNVQITFSAACKVALIQLGSVY